MGYVIAKLNKCICSGPGDIQKLSEDLYQDHKDPLLRPVRKDIIFIKRRVDSLIEVDRLKKSNKEYQEITDKMNTVKAFLDRRYQAFKEKAEEEALVSRRQRIAAKEKKPTHTINKLSSFENLADVMREMAEAETEKDTETKQPEPVDENISGMQILKIFNEFATEKSKILNVLDKLLDPDEPTVVFDAALIIHSDKPPPPQLKTCGMVWQNIGSGFYLFRNQKVAACNTKSKFNYRQTLGKYVPLDKNFYFRDKYISEVKFNWLVPIKALKFTFKFNAIAFPWSETTNTLEAEPEELTLAQQRELLEKYLTMHPQVKQINEKIKKYEAAKTDSEARVGVWSERLAKLNDRIDKKEKSVQDIADVKKRASTRRFIAQLKEKRKTGFKHYEAASDNQLLIYNTLKLYTQREAHVRAELKKRLQKYISVLDRSSVQNFENDLIKYLDNERVTSS